MISIFLEINGGNMKNTLKHYELTIKAQEQQISELIEERDMLKRSLKRELKAISELWETYLSEVGE